MRKIFIKSTESPTNIYHLYHVCVSSDWQYFEVIKKPKYGIGEEHLTSADTEPEALEAIADAYLKDYQDADY